jgi:diguanylate cyclase (GGDEF)-like protein
MGSSPRSVKLPLSWEQRNAALITFAFAVCYGIFAFAAFPIGETIRGRLALGTAVLQLLLSVLAWQGLRLTLLYPLVLGLITALVWVSVPVLTLSHQNIPGSMLSSCGFVAILAFTWFPFRSALYWVLAAYLPALGASLWLPYADPPSLVVGIMLVLLIGYMSRYTHHLIQTQKDRARFQDLAIRDPLTGLYNRRVPLDQLEGMLAHQPVRQNVAVVLLDIDLFKRINDTFGHTRGDDTLTQVATLLSQQLPAGTMLCRWGGEEFLAVLYGVSLSHAQAVVEAVLTHVRQTRIEDVNLTLSAGGAMLAEAPTVHELIALADQRLYAAKGAGRDQARWARTEALGVPG